MEQVITATATGRATIGPKGRVTIPSHIREQIKVAPGDEVVFHVVDGKVEMVPMAMVPRDQVWFYSEKMRERIEKAELDIAQGKTERVSTPKASQAHLDRLKGRKK
jgi:antitoxin MazE